MSRNRFVVGIAALALASGASAAPVLFTASSGNLAATALFDTSGTNFIVTLTNTSTFDVLSPSDVLTGVFFDMAGGPFALTRISAVLGAGSTVYFGGTDPGGVVGGEFAYSGTLSGAPGGVSYGISSAGLGLFGPANLFPGNNLQGPIDPNGIQYGITSPGDNPATGNAAVTGSNALICNQVVCTLGNLPLGFNPATAISHVTFQYGTALTEPSLPGAPASGGLAVLGLAGLVASRRRR